jgi:hypothetical protein
VKHGLPSASLRGVAEDRRIIVFIIVMSGIRWSLCVSSLRGVGRKTILSEGPQASPSRPSYKGSMEVKWSGWLEAAA